MAPCALLLPALASSCAPQPESQAFNYTVFETSTTIKSGAVTIEIQQNVPYVSTRFSGGGEERSEDKLNGHPFGLRGDVFYIGDREYGPARSRVDVSAKGVVIDGEERGELPPFKYQ
jgi:hypothetical protein